MNKGIWLFISLVLLLAATIWRLAGVAFASLPTGNLAGALASLTAALPSQGTAKRFARIEINVVAHSLAMEGEGNGRRH